MENFTYIKLAAGGIVVTQKQVAQNAALVQIPKLDHVFHTVH